VRSKAVYLIKKAPPYGDVELVGSEGSALGPGRPITVLPVTRNSEVANMTLAAPRPCAAKPSLPAILRSGLTALSPAALASAMPFSCRLRSHASRGSVIRDEEGEAAGRGMASTSLA
jgi:hypothetical protein